VYYIETVRSGPFPKRLYGSKDGVVIDLAVHDLDLVAYLGGELEQLYSHQIRVGDRRQDAYARVMLKTKKGILGSCEFSWISPRKERSISVFGDKGMLLANMLDQELWFYENGDVEVDYSDNYFQNVLLGRVSEGRVIKFPIRKEEPLRKELDFFLALVSGSAGEHDSSYGKRAVAYSLSVLCSGQRDEIIRFG
jgi:predicted dehydrogenase